MTWFDIEWHSTTMHHGRLDRRRLLKIIPRRNGEGGQILPSSQISLTGVRAWCSIQPTVSHIRTRHHRFGLVCDHDDRTHRPLTKRHFNTCVNIRGFGQRTLPRTKSCRQQTPNRYGCSDALNESIVNQHKPQLYILYTFTAGHSYRLARSHDHTRFYPYTWSVKITHVALNSNAGIRQNSRLTGLATGRRPGVKLRYSQLVVSGTKLIGDKIVSSSNNNAKPNYTPPSNERQK